MALNFPSSPTNGQAYDNWIYSSSKGAWEAKPLDSAKTITADVSPANPDDGDQWFNTNDGTLYIYVVDTDGGQWVESQAPITANGYYSPNYLINGGFDINQRAFTSSTNSGAYGLDRWRVGPNGGTVTYSAQSFALGTAPVTGLESRNFMRVVTSGQSAAGDFAFPYQPVESVRTLAGQTVTVSFYAKAGSGTPRVAVELNQFFGSNGSPSPETLTLAGHVTLSTTWSRYSVTATVPSLAGKTIGTLGNDALNVALWISAGSNFNSRTGSLGIQNNTFDFWGLQLEEGTVATTFRRSGNTIQEELANCQRYYNRVFAPASSPGNNTGFVLGLQQSTTASRFSYQAPVVMRVAPAVSMTAVDVSDDWSFATPPTAVTTFPNNSSQSIYILTQHVSSGVQARPVVLRSQFANNSFIEFSSEL